MTAINNALAASTVWKTLAECEAAMASGRGGQGYVPTIRPTTRRTRFLVRVLRARGWRVWTGE